MIAELRTERLKLRAIGVDDISSFVPMLNDFDVAKNLAPVPFPYTDQDGREFIVRTERSRACGIVLNYAVLLWDETFIGFCTANIEDEGRRPGPGKRELGYWYGKSYWRCGYATEAARAVVVHAFETLGTDALTSGWFVDNPASGRVLAKLGFVPAGKAERMCLSRGTTVMSNRVELTREAFAGTARR